MATLAQLLGGEAAAAQWMNTRVHWLVVQHRMDPNAALDLVEQAITDHDPAILAEPGQVWTLRPEVELASPELAPVLFVAERLDAGHLVVEDGRTGTAIAPVTALHAYELDYWHRPA
jgi:hypothetical protein